MSFCPKSQWNLWHSQGEGPRSLLGWHLHFPMTHLWQLLISQVLQLFHILHGLWGDFESSKSTFTKLIAYTGLLGIMALCEFLFATKQGQRRKPQVLDNTTITCRKCLGHASGTISSSSFLPILHIQLGMSILVSVHLAQCVNARCDLNIATEKNIKAQTWLRAWINNTHMGTISF